MGEPKKHEVEPPWVTKAVFGIGGLVALAITVRLCSVASGTPERHEERAADPPREVEQPAAPPQAAPPPTPTPQQKKQPGTDEDFRLGEFTYNVHSIMSYAALGEKKASDGARFVVVEFTIRNESNATKTVLTDDFRMVDSQGREFSPSSDGNLALSMSGGRDLIVTQLQPGLAKKLSTAFEMPEVATRGALTLVIPEKGMLGSDSVRITVR